MVRLSLIVDFRHFGRQGLDIVEGILKVHVLLFDRLICLLKVCCYRYEVSHDLGREFVKVLFCHYCVRYVRGFLKLGVFLGHVTFNAVHSFG